MTQNRLSTASDVYSYAIIMYEMLTWQMPFHDLSKEQVRSGAGSRALLASRLVLAACLCVFYNCPRSRCRQGAAAAVAGAAVMLSDVRDCQR